MKKKNAKHEVKKIRLSQKELEGVAGGRKTTKKATKKATRL